MKPKFGIAVSAKDFASFLTLPGEKIVVATRQHWYVILGPLLILAVFVFLFGSIAYIFGIVLFPSPLLFITTLVALIALLSSLLMKILVDWYFHLYVVTTRRIMEICSTPLFSHSVNDVLLDQVKCTEIDVQTNGIMQELLDVGDVVVTFDRPTHQDEFRIGQIKDPRLLGVLLGNALVTQVDPNRQTVPVWYRQKTGPKMFRFTEEIFQQPQIGVD